MMTAFVIRKKKKEKDRKVSRLSSMRPLINLKANAIYCRVCETLNAQRCIKSTVLTFVKNTGPTSIQDNVQPTVAYVTCLTTIYLTK